jgi:TrmH family RNA methyltransferase
VAGNAAACRTGALINTTFANGMLSKNQAKFISSLRLKKNRDEHGLFLAEGGKIVNDILHSGIKVKQIFSSRNFQLSIFNYQIEVIRIKESELRRISSLSTPNEVLAVCEIPEYKLEWGALQKKISLVLDTIQDPGNLGTIIRVADWFGIENIICSPDTVEVYNPKVIQATMGSISRVKVHYRELAGFLQEAKTKLRNLRVYGALLQGENLYDQELTGEGLIVLGNESKGISEPIQALLTHRISIPNYGKGAESLNAAIATAVICAEFKRRN